MFPLQARTTMLWRFSANDTHLYPGTVLRCLDVPGKSRLSAGDGLLVEFSDGIIAGARLLQAEPNAAVLQMPGYRTQRGTTVAARTWRIVPGGEPGLAKVHKRLPAA
ncbi:MAG: hypothetical protein QM777_14380 [Pseudorhodoferax sp.]